jgi:hypothetical protein
MGAVTTRSYSNLRDGACFDETKLTSIWVQKNGIRVMGEFKLDDPRGTEGQVLFVPFIMMRDKQVHNVAYVCDMSNNVYAFDTDTYNLLWKQHIARPVKVDRTLDMWGISPWWGILSTPVIDLNTATIYCVALNSHDGTIGTAQYELHGLDLVDGSYRFPPLPLNGAAYQNFRLGSTPRKQRPGLLLDTRNGRTTVFIAFGSFYESASTNQGWVVAVDVTHVPTISATWVTGTKYPAAGIWMGGQGLSMDPDGFLYGMTGNGGFEPPTDFGECFFKLRYAPPSDSTDGKLECIDWWSPYSDTGRDGMDPTLPAFGSKMGENAGKERLWATNAMHEMSMPMMDGMEPTNANRVKDEDLGSAGALPIHSSVTGFRWNGLFGAGKDGVGYMVNADQMGQTQNADFAPGKTDANFDKLIFPQPYNWTDYLGGFDARKNPMTIPGLYQNYTKHQHATPVLWKSPDHGWMMFTQGENSPVRAYQLNEDGFKYLACGNEIASAGMPAPGGMPGGCLTLSSSGQGTNTGILWASMPLNGDANRHVVQGRLVLYGANWLSGTPGSATLIKIWDSYQWGVYYLHAKFNAAPTIANGKAFLPSFDGRVLVLG